MPEPTPILEHLGATVRRLRTARGWSRRDLALQAEVSERFLADIELGRGNCSVLRLCDLARALEVGPDTLLTPPPVTAPDATIALLGLRGAGKSTVGTRLAELLHRPFVELDRRVEDTSRLSLEEIFQMHGEAYYRRIEHDVLRELVTGDEPVVLATGGGVVTSRPSFELLRQRAKTVWLHAEPQDHWQRVVAQGDTRPMAGNDQAFLDLCSILQEREPLYRQAELQIETSGKTVDEVCAELVQQFAQGGQAES